MEEAKVTTGEPEVGSPNADRGTVLVTVPILGEQPEGWYAIFVEMPPGVSFTLNMPEMQFGNGKTVMFNCPPDQVQQVVTHIRERVEGANRYWNAQVLPQLRAKQERADQKRQDDAEKEKQLLEEANRALENLP